jgi:NTE family protein
MATSITDIKYLAFKGCGVCGEGYLGSLEVLEQNGIPRQLKGVAGVSAGSITAGLISLGYTSSELNAIMAATDLKDFCDKWNPIGLLRSYGLYKGNYFLNWIKDKIEKKTGNPNSTFADFNRLGLIPLSGIACSSDDGIPCKFSLETTPHTVVAEFIRASMSIPEFFEEFIFTTGEYKGKPFIDGGTMENYPITMFDESCKCSNDSVLGLFPYDVNVRKEYKPIGKWQPLKKAARYFEMIMDAQDANDFSNPLIMERTIIIDTHGISATNFDITVEQKTILYNSGKTAVLNYLKKL